MRVDGQRHVPAVLSPGKTQYPLYRRLSEPQGRSGRVRKILPPPGFDPRTVQAAESLYAVYAIPASSLNMWAMKISRAKIETVIRTEPNVCSIWFVAAALQILPFLLMTT